MSVTRYPTFAQCAPVAARDVAQLKVIDVGANPIDGTPPYRTLLDQHRCTVVGFEPDPDAHARLLSIKGPHETYHRAAVGDGHIHTLHICASGGMTSLLAPNMELLSRFHGFSQWAAVQRTAQVPTVTLDSVPGTIPADMLKIDIQGFELQVFQYAPRVLDSLLLIQTEVEFLPLYINQPLFSEIELFLRSKGFMLHRFWPLKSRTLRPMLINRDIYFGLSQTFDADAIFIPSFDRWPAISTSRLTSLALMLHDMYGSFDLAYALLCEIDKRTGGRDAPAYLAALNTVPNAALFESHIEAAP
jgi:FkbM family methyltransferase